MRRLFHVHVISEHYHRLHMCDAVLRTIRWLTLKALARHQKADKARAMWVLEVREREREIAIR